LAVLVSREPVCQYQVIPLGDPVCVKVTPTSAHWGEFDVGSPGSAGNAFTVKSEELVAVPRSVVTVIGPVVAPEGNVAVISVGVFTVYDAEVPLKLTSDTLTKVLPVITTEAPDSSQALSGEKPVMDGPAHSIMVTTTSPVAPLPPVRLLP